MKHKRKSKLFLFLLFIINVGILPSGQAFVKGDAAIHYGSIIRLEHIETERYIAAGDEKYSTGSQQNAVYALYDVDPNDDRVKWLVRSMHSQQSSPHGANPNQTVKEHDDIILENVKTKKILCLRHDVNAPSGREIVREASTQSYDAHGRINQAYERVSFAWLKPGSDGVVVDGTECAIRSRWSGWVLRSEDGSFFDRGKDYQEVSCSGRNVDADKNHFFRIELVSTPAQHNFRDLKGRWQADRGPKLQYNTFIYIDPTSTGRTRGVEQGNDWEVYTAGNHFRLWTVASNSFTNKDAKEPDRHVTLFAGPWNNSSQGAASWFLLQKANAPAEKGPVKYGDKIKIFSLFGTPGWNEFAGVFSPPKRWRVHKHHSDTWSASPTILISNPEHADFRSNNGLSGLFTLEPTMRGLKEGDEIHQHDLIQIRSLGSVQNSKPRTLWVDIKNTRQILANDNDDNAGLQSDLKNHRNNLFHRLRMHHVNKNTIPATSVNDFNRVLRGFNEWIKTAEEEAKKEEEKRKQEEAEAKAKAEAEAKEKAEAEAEAKAKQEAEAKEKEKQVQPEVSATKEIVVFGGFDPLPGELTHIAAGLKHVKKDGSIIHELRAWGITKDNTLVEMQEGENPWLVHPAKDDTGATLPPFKSIAIGFDGTTYAVTTGGEVYRYNWPNEPRSSMPGKTKKKRKKKKKKKKTKKPKKRRKKKKVKQEKKLKGTILKK